MKQKDLVKVSYFTRKYSDPSFPVRWGTVNFSGTSKEHQDMVYEICWWLHKNDIPFATEVRFESGYRPDIICPTHIKPIIEVRHSEEDKQTMSKFARIPEELQQQIIYVEAGQPFNEKLIL